MAGAASATAIKMSRTAAPLIAARLRRKRRHASRQRLLGGRSAIRNAWIDDRVQHVYQQVDQDELQGEQKQRGLDDSEVAITDRVHQEQANARIREYGLGDDRAR